MGERLKFFRKRAEMTQRDLSEILGLSPNAVHTWEKTSLERVGYYRLRLICRTLGCRMGDLFPDDYDIHY